MLSKEIEKELLKLQDKNYKDFQSKIISNIESNTIIGIRTPILRNYAKKLIKEGNYESFLEDLPHFYFEENQLHAFIISEISDQNECLNYLEKFLPFVDNWATCDQLTPKTFKKNKKELVKHIKNWIHSKETYTIRFGIKMLMQYFLDNEFQPDYLNIVANINSNEYYVNMMRAWFFATALAKQYEVTLKYIEDNKLDKWTHNKTIQKAIESYRITKEQKDYLKQLKIKE